MSDWQNGVKKTVTVERKSQYGIYAAGEWLNLSKKAKEAGLSPTSFETGKSYELEGSLAPEKNGKRQYFIDSYRPGGPGAASQTAAAANATIPGANAPAPTAKPAVDYAKRESDKDAKITVLAIVKSVIESPALPLLVTDSLSLRKVVEEESRYLLDMVDRITDERKGV